MTSKLSPISVLLFEVIISNKDIGNTCFKSISPMQIKIAGKFLKEYKFKFEMVYVERGKMKV